MKTTPRKRWQDRALDWLTRLLPWAGLYSLSKLLDVSLLPLESHDGWRDWLAFIILYSALGSLSRRIVDDLRRLSGIGYEKAEPTRISPDLYTSVQAELAAERATPQT